MRRASASRARLGFDALFQFSPFAFIVDLQAGVTLKWHGRTLLGVDLDMTLSGPSPWHARGKATFKIWRFSKSMSFDRTLGEDAPPPPLPAADPLPELVAALADRRNWSAQLPATSGDARHVARDARRRREVLLHPLGELTVRQRVVPLGIEHQPLRQHDAQPATAASTSSRSAQAVSPAPDADAGRRPLRAGAVPRPERRRAAAAAVVRADGRRRAGRRRPA